MSVLRPEEDRLWLLKERWRSRLACGESADVSSGGGLDTRPVCRFRRGCGLLLRKWLGSTGFSAPPRCCAWNTASSSGWWKPPLDTDDQRRRRQLFGYLLNDSRKH